MTYSITSSAVPSVDAPQPLSLPLHVQAWKHPHSPLLSASQSRSPPCLIGSHRYRLHPLQRTHRHSWLCVRGHICPTNPSPARQTMFAAQTGESRWNHQLCAGCRRNPTKRNAKHDKVPMRSVKYPCQQEGRSRRLLGASANQGSPSHEGRAVNTGKLTK